jgi:hypothetical protein
VKYYEKQLRQRSDEIEKASAAWARSPERIEAIKSYNDSVINTIGQDFDLQTKAVDAEQKAKIKEMLESDRLTPEMKRDLEAELRSISSAAYDVSIRAYNKTMAQNAREILRGLEQNPEVAAKLPEGLQEELLASLDAPLKQRPDAIEAAMIKMMKQLEGTPLQELLNKQQSDHIELLETYQTATEVRLRETEKIIKKYS